MLRSNALRVNSVNVLERQVGLLVGGLVEMLDDLFE